jgi:hypothetical protein
MELGMHPSAHKVKRTCMKAKKFERYSIPKVEKLKDMYFVVTRAINVDDKLFKLK